MIKYKIFLLTHTCFNFLYKKRGLFISLEKRTKYNVTILEKRTKHAKKAIENGSNYYSILGDEKKTI